MFEDRYSPALLKPEEIEEIQEIEQRLSNKTGQPITIIAYQANNIDGTND